MRLQRTIGRIMDLTVAAGGDRIAATLGDETVSFRQCDQRSNRMARVLASLGLRRGDRLMFWSPISLAAVDVFMATQKLGVAFVPFKDILSVEEAAPLVAYIRPRLLLADASLADRAAALGAITGVAFACFGGGGPRRDIDTDIDRLLASTSDHRLDEAAVEEEDIHAIFLTSGSTGQPKGVMVSHRASWNRSFCGNMRAQAFGGRGDINMFPLFHWAGWHFMLCAWIHGRACHFTRSADAASLAGLIEAWHPSYMYAIPAIWERLLTHTAPFQTRSLRTIGTGTYRVEPAMVDALRQKFPRAVLTIGWGATEFGVGLQIDDDDIDAHPYSIGLPVPGNEVRLVDGELCGRSDQMMTGYFDRPELTAAAMRDGWYYSGDMAEQDADGYFSITGRLREIIRSGAETIAPAEVEAAIANFPGVAEVSVIGMPDISWGEIVCAAIVLRPGAELPSVELLRAHVAPRLAPFKHPRRVVQLHAIPRTAATGQIQRSAVRDYVLAHPP